LQDLVEEGKAVGDEEIWLGRIRGADGGDAELIEEGLKVRWVWEEMVSKDNKSGVREPGMVEWDWGDIVDDHKIEDW
jgi:hypothetical protein